MKNEYLSTKQEIGVWRGGWRFRSGCFRRGLVVRSFFIFAAVLLAVSDASLASAAEDRCLASKPGEGRYDCSAYLRQNCLTANAYGSKKADCDQHAAKLEAANQASRDRKVLNFNDSNDPIVKAYNESEAVLDKFREVQEMAASEASPKDAGKEGADASEEEDGESASDDCGPGFETQGNVCIPTETGLSDATVTDILVKLLQWLVGIVGFLGILAFLVSGAQYLLAFGDEDTIKTAKQNMTWSMVGITLAFAAVVIIRAIAAFFAS
jgi:hypothetical protein